MEYTVREAREDDLPGIVEIVNREIAENFAHFGMEPATLEEFAHDWVAQHERYPWFVAVGDQVLGYCKASPWKSRGAYFPTCEIGVYVRPEHHGLGIGKALYRELFPVLSARGFHTVIAGVALPNDASVRLHEAFGMKYIGVFPAVGYKFGKWIDVAYWALELSPSPQP